MALTARKTPSGVFFRRNVAERERVCREHIRQRRVAGRRPRITLVARRICSAKIIVRFNQTAVGHLHGRMVGTQFLEQNVERDGLRALRRKFLDEPAIDLARPGKSEMKADASVLHGGDAGILDGDEGEVGGDRRGEMERGFCAQVIGHALQPLEEIQPQQPQAANEREDGERPE